MKTNKLLSVALTLCVLLAAFSLTAFAADGAATVGGTAYATLESAIEAATPDASGVITYEISGKVTVDSTGWVQVAKAGLSGLTKVEFIGKTADAEICITGGLAILADQKYDLDVSFKDLTLSKPNPTYGGDYGHATNYFTCWLRNDGAAENTVTYTNCTFPNGACNNQYGKTVFDNCTFSNAVSGLYNLWNYGGSTEVKNSSFTGARGIKTYNEGTLETAPVVKVADTTFTGLTEKAAIVVSKSTDVTLNTVTATDCKKGLLQKDIEGSTAAEKVTIEANGSDISGKFSVNGNKGVDAADNEFNITGGTFTAEVPADYLKDGFTLANNGDGTYGVKESQYVAEVNGVKFATLADAIAAAKDGETVTLTADKTEDVTIDKNITLDLGTKTLTNAGAGKATLTVAKGATATVKNGSIVGGASYYTIQNNGTATFEELTATAGNTGSSMLDNWGDLTINSGTYIGGLDTVKSEEDSKLTITGGKFVSDYAPKYNVTGTILVYGETAITGGEFVQNSTSTAARVVVTGVVEGHTPSLTKVSGGKFTTKSSGAIFHWMGKATPDNFEVSGGSYSKSVSELVCADGFIPTKNADGTYGVKVGKYVAKIGSTKYETLADAVRLAAKGKTIKLLDDLDISATGLTIAATKTVTLDLNGHTLKAANTNTGNIKVLGKLTLCDSTDTAKNGTGTGKVWTDTPYIYNQQDKVLIAAMDGGTFTMESGLIDTASSIKDNANGGQFAVSVQNKHADATVIINGGHIKAGWYAVAGNGTDITYNGNITVNGGILESVADYAIYHPHTGTTTVNGGVIFGAAGGISLNRGKLIVNDGTITSKGTGTTGNWGDGTGNQQAAAINVNAKYETTAVEIKGGKITAEKDAILLTNGRNGTVAVSGGTFSSEIKSEYCAKGFEPVANTDGTYTVGAKKAVEVWTGYTGTSVAAYATVAEAAANLGGNKWIVITGDYTLTADFTIPADVRLDVADGAVLTVANGVTLTVAADAKRLAARTGAAIVNNGTILVCGTSYSKGYVMVQEGGTLDLGTLTVPEGCFLDNNGSNYFAAVATYSITYADGTTKQAGSLNNLSGAVRVTLLKNVTDFARSFNSTDALADNFVFDLGGHTLSGKANASSQVMTIAAPMTVTNGTIVYASSDENYGAILTNDNVTFDASVTVDGGVGYALWTNGYGKTVAFNGTAVTNGAYAITGNGAENGGLVADCSLVVGESASISAANGIAIYHPMLGTVSVTGGKISGHTGIEMCAGKLVVSGGEITSTGANHDETGSANAIKDGAAISIINRNYPGGTPSLTITGGTFKAEGADALSLKVYDFTAGKVAEWSDAGNYVNISGGSFKEAVLPAYCAAGFMPARNTDGTYTVAEQAENPFGKSFSVVNKPVMTQDGVEYYTVVVYSGIDSLNYKKAGFAYRMEATKKNGETVKTQDVKETTTAYKAISGTNNQGKTYTYTAEQIGAAYIYGQRFLFSVSDYTSANTALYVTPYVVTLDGKTIYGDEIELTETALTAKDSHLFWQGQ